MDGHPNTPDIEILGDCQKNRFALQRSTISQMPAVEYCAGILTPKQALKLLQNSNVTEGHPRLKCDSE